MKKTRIQDEKYKEGTESQFIRSLELGPWTSYSMMHDPKHMCFVLSRYKFVSKMLDGKKKVLEVGCGDGFGFPIVAQAVSQLHGIDRDERLLEGNRTRLKFIKNAKFYKLDISDAAPKEKYDAAFSIDVIEHLAPPVEKKFIENTVKCLKNDAICIIGTPNVTAQKYATHRSSIEHINLKSSKELKNLLAKYFENSFIFSMNDEVVHTGYYPMAHYLFAIGVGLKNK